MNNEFFQYPDNELIDLLLDEVNRKKVFEVLVLRYQKQLYWHIRKMVLTHDDTNDVLQNTLIKIWNGILQFKGESKVFTWMYRIATNESLNFLEQKKRKAYASLDDVNLAMLNSLKSDNYFNGDEAAFKLQAAILTLPEKQRLVFNMKYFEEFSYNDMSEILETSVGALKASYHHAVKKIEHYLQNN